MAAFDHQYTMGVFKLKDKGGVKGDLLTVCDTGSSSGSNDGNGSNEGGSSGSRQAGGSNEGGSRGGGQAGGSNGSSGQGSASAEGGNAEDGNALGDMEEGELDGDDSSVTVVDVDQQKGCKKRRVGSPAAEAGVSEGCRVLTFQEYLQQRRAGKKQLAVSAE
jgi:hypothetical protein